MVQLFHIHSTLVGMCVKLLGVVESFHKTLSEIAWYTAAMPTSHSIIELRTGRDSEPTAVAAQQLFSNLPSLKDSLWQRLQGTHEHISFEIYTLNQTVYFAVYVPTRLVEYTEGILQSSFPQVMLTTLEHDPLDHFSLDPKLQERYADQQSPFLEIGSLHLDKNDSISLRTYRDIDDVDPLGPVLSSLSKAQQHEFSPKHRRRKVGAHAFRTAVRIAVSTPSQTRSRLLLETTANAFGTLNADEGNRLELKRSRIFRQRFLSAMKERRLPWFGTAHFSVEELATLYHPPHKDLSHIQNLAWGKTLLGEPPEDLPIVTSDMDDEFKSNVNVFARTDYKNESYIYGLKRPDRRRHVYAIGKTGTGKSTLLANMAINDLKNNEGMAVIDPHGDLVETLLDYIPSHRINDVVYFNPTDKERTVKLNLFEGGNIEHRELIASGIVSIFQKLYHYSWGPRLEYILRNTLLTLLKHDQSKLSDIIDVLTDHRFRNKVLSKVDDPVLRNFWENEFGEMHARQRNEAVSPILNKVGQFVSSPMIRNVVNTHKSSFDLEEVMDDGKILLVNLSQGKLGEDNAALLGAMLITKIQLAAMSRVNTAEEDRRDFYLYVDEFQNFATESFVKILSEARKYRLNLTLANQYIAQIPESVQKAIFGNCGSMISFVLGADDAAALQKEYGELYSQEDLVHLGRYQIVNKISIDNVISRPFPAHTLPLASSSNKNREKVIRVSRERYGSKN